ncbi:MAG TPA: hypothetical protein VJW20_05920 [Candidatus Angelobacter sp.]|nr:hypothetical protein [Candidatus Angelobacter sp.]
MKKLIIITIALTLSAIATGLISAPEATPARIRKLLKDYEPTEPGTLAHLFKYGDSRMSELIIALNDPDARVRENAQRVIRYLGNPEGMRAIFSQNGNGKAMVFTGPVPVPLSEWDYVYLEKEVLCDRCQLNAPQVDYIYALALDQSPRAQETLSRIKSKTKLPWLYGNPITPEGSGDEKVLRNLIDRAFYLDAEDKKASTVRLVARTVDGQKALYEIHVDQSALAEKWFHIVLEKDGPGWRYLSVSLAAES